MSYVSNPYSPSDGEIKPQRPQGGYANIYQLGGEFINRKEQEPGNFANPLTYTVIPNYSTYFDHGPSLSEMISRTYQPTSQNFMAEYCAESDFDNFCQVAMQLNTYDYYPNNVAIDSLSNNFCNIYFKYKPTNGEMTLRNACERRFLDFPAVMRTYQPFDYTVANSPMIPIYQSMIGNVGRPIVHNLDDPEQIQNSELVRKMIEFPITCFDVLLRIYAAYYLFHDPNVKIQNTVLEDFFEKNKPLFEKVYPKILHSIPNYNLEANAQEQNTSSSFLYENTNPYGFNDVTGERCANGIYRFKNN